jgi:hypothetical protein
MVEKIRIEVSMEDLQDADNRTALGRVLTDEWDKYHGMLELSGTSCIVSLPNGTAVITKEVEE